MEKEMTDEEIREIVEKRWIAGGRIGSLTYAIRKEKEDRILAARRRYANALRTVQDIPNEKGDLT